MKTLYLDCFSGISGNMFIGMLLQAGVPFDKFQVAINDLGLDGYTLIHETVSKLGITATYFNVALDSEQTEHYHDHEHHHAHDHEHDHHHNHLEADSTGHHHHHEHRGLKEVPTIIDSSKVTTSVKAKSLAVFQQLAEAEAKVHGVPIQEIHFHEVGAIDCIIDIVGTIWALEFLGIEQIGVSPLHAGSGFVHCAHGIMPVPAPATAELLAGLPWYSTEIKGELVTPTGAALVKTLATYKGLQPKNFVHTITAYGAGTKDLEIPNVLRGYIGEDDLLK